MNPAELLQEGVEQGWHLGAQLCVVYQGEMIIDFASGHAREGVPMTTGSLLQWYSSGKPLTAVLIAMLVDRRLLEFDRRVAEIIPEFGQNGKDAITYRHLLTHTAGFRAADKVQPDTPWAEMISKICAAPGEVDWPLGEKAGYSTAASWYLLAETAQRLAGQPFDELIKRELLDPLGMTNTWLRLPFAKTREYGDRLAQMYKTEQGRKELLPLQDPEGMAICRPGASARGPVRELSYFYSMLLNRGKHRGQTFLKPETVAELTRRHRVGLYDHTFMHTLDFGLGFIINSNRYGAQTVPYGYGVHASDETFGHSGAQTSCGFADPVRDLVVVWATNGQPGERQHQIRQRTLNTAIYEHLD